MHLQPDSLDLLLVINFAQVSLVYYIAMSRQRAAIGNGTGEGSFSHSMDHIKVYE